MGTHPIFESDFDCLTAKMVILVDVIREGFCEQVEHSHSRAKCSIILIRTEFPLVESETKKQVNNIICDVGSPNDGEFIRAQLLQRDLRDHQTSIWFAVLMDTQTM